jgi:hypothetical protein
MDRSQPPSNASRAGSIVMLVWKSISRAHACLGGCAYAHVRSCVAWQVLTVRGRS